MPSAVTHAIVGFALGKTFAPKERPLKFWLLAVFCSILPDVDVLSFFFGWRHGILGHRGLSHSLFFALLLSLLVLWVGFRDLPKFSKPWWGLWAFFFLLTSIHGFLDALTNGGSGVAFFSPFDNSRYFLPWSPIKVSPIGVKRFFSPWGREVFVSEIVRVWIPGFLLLLAVKGLRGALTLRKKNGRAVVS